MNETSPANSLDELQEVKPTDAPACGCSPLHRVMKSILYLVLFVVAAGTVAAQASPEVAGQIIQLIPEDFIPEAALPMIGVKGRT